MTGSGTMGPTSARVWRLAPRGWVRRRLGWDDRVTIDAEAVRVAPRGLSSPARRIRLEDIRLAATVELTGVTVVTGDGAIVTLTAAGTAAEHAEIVDAIRARHPRPSPGGPPPPLPDGWGRARLGDGREVIGPTRPPGWGLLDVDELPEPDDGSAPGEVRPLIGPDEAGLGQLARAVVLEPGPARLVPVPPAARSGAGAATGTGVEPVVAGLRVSLRNDPQWGVCCRLDAVAPDGSADAVLDGVDAEEVLDLARWLGHRLGLTVD